jgi:methionine--tRNA ligase beta chain
MHKDIISYDDFAKLDVAIGVIIAVEEIEGADKLLKLSVDVGEATPRQILSGIKEFFPDIQALVGKRCPFLINLQPRTIRGLESQGMILAANTEDMFALLCPDADLPAGTRVH